MKILILIELQSVLITMIEQLMQTNTNILDELNSVINIINFARLNFLHPSGILYSMPQESI